MPGMKGDELLKAVHTQLPKTLTILLTGQADTTAIGNAVNHARLYRYIPKPWDETDLVLTIKEAVKSFLQDKKLEQKNKELVEFNNTLELRIKQRTAEIVRQKNIIEEKNNDITDSINYAQKIQNAVLPTHEYISRIIPDYFVFYKPKDIVSGDFYWIKQINNTVVIAVADCTGHGVPGAFMSILGISLLNEIVVNTRLNSSNELLELLREKIKSVLHQTGEKYEARDGMDIALGILNSEAMELQFSGANRSLYVCRNNELMEYKGDRQPVAIYVNEKPFNQHTIKLAKDDVVYMFSDGFIDQFGGTGGSKFLTSNFKELLRSICTIPMTEQKKTLEDTLASWKGNCEQIDDILVVGFKIT
jgi:serine phosphatase RsbU (regulator of sigma subunit)